MRPPRLFAAVLVAALGTVQARGQCPISLQAASRYPVELSQAGVAVDLDGDGAPELVLATGSGLSMFPATGGGRFGPRRDVALPYGLRHLAAADLDGDGDADLAGVSHDRLVVLRGAGDGTLGPPATSPLGTFLVGIAIDDVDADGAADLVAVDTTLDVMFVLIANGDGTFVPPVAVPLGESPTSLRTADLDRDADVDVLVSTATNGTSNVYAVLLGRGDGTFLPARAYAGPITFANDVETGDFDEDGIIDGALQSRDEVAVMRGVGDGTFGAAMTYATPGWEINLDVGDANGDGHLDLVVGSGSTVPSVLFGRGDGTFADITSVNIGGQHAFLHDLDGDGIDDIVALGNSVNWPNIGTWVDVAVGTEDGSFADTPVYAPAGGAAVAAADVDGDGDVDLASAGQYGPITLSLLLGRGDGTFEPGPDLSFGIELRTVAFGDWNADGRPDLVCGEIARLFILSNLGDGRFSTPVEVATPLVPTRILAGDVDEDGAVDIVANAIGTISIHFGDGSGGFPSRTDFYLGYCSDFGIGDMDRDGSLDVVASCGYAVVVALGRGDGTFLAPRSFPELRGARLALLDANGDGSLDVALSLEGKKDVAIHANPGDGTLAPASVRAFPGFVGDLARADLDDDGLDDLVVVVDEWAVAACAAGGGGAYGPPSLHGLAGPLTRMAAADLDGDGLDDVAVPQPSLLGAGVLLNAGLALRPAGLPAGVVGAPYQVQLAALDATPPVVFSVAGGAMPPGLSLRSDGLLAGTPTTWGHFRVVVGVLDGAGCQGRKPYDVSIGAAVHYLVGQGLGQPNPNRVRLLEPSGVPTTTDFLAYGAGGWGVNVAGKDIDAIPDGEILTAPGPGAVYGPQLRAFREGGGAVAKVNFYAYGTLRYGANLAATDLDGDGIGELLSGAGPGAVFGPHVRAFNHDGGTTTPISIVNFFAYGTLRYGVDVAGARLDADAYGELITAPGPGAAFGPVLRGFDCDGAPVSVIGGINVDPFATAGYGARSAGGDVDGDGFDEILAAPGPGPLHATRAVGLDYDGALVVPLPGFDTTRAGVAYGGRAGAGDTSGDGRAELLLGAGPDPAASSLVETLRYDGTALIPYGSYVPFPLFHGVVASSLELSP